MTHAIAKDVTCEISTRNRYFSTLPLTLTGIGTQTLLPAKLIIYDDNPEESRIKDLREEHLYRCIFSILHNYGVDVRVLYGKGIGQVSNHQHALQNATTKYIWRIDDDEQPEANVLEALHSFITTNKDVAAVGCNVYFAYDPRIPKPMYANGNYETEFDNTSPEWYVREEAVMDVKHLYSTFLYDRQIALDTGGYPMNLSRVGHHEESRLTTQMALKGHRLSVLNYATVWHFHERKGGIRDNTTKDMWDNDVKLYDEFLSEHGLHHKKRKCFHFGGGMGDNYMALMAFSEIYKMYKDAGYEELYIGATVPDVFNGEIPIEVKVSHINELLVIGKLRKEDSIYHWCAKNEWKGNMIDAYIAKYKEEL